MSMFENKIGDKNGAITILELIKGPWGSGQESKLKIRCDCGKEKLISTSNYIRTKSCGACGYNTGENNRSFTGYKEIHGKTFYRIKKLAAQRSIEFKLTIEELWDLFLKQGRKCAISGRDIKFAQKTDSKERTASLDRIDVEKPYQIGNVQWVHKDMNEFKWDKSPKELSEYCQVVLNHDLRKKITSVPKDDLQNIVDGLGEDNYKFENQTILLTGSSGFLGILFQAYFLYINEHVLKSPCRVICLDNKPCWIGNFNHGFNNFRYVTHNLMFPLESIFIGERFDYILNCSGIGSPKYYEKYPLETFNISTIGVQNVLNLAGTTNVKSILNFSSSEVYATPPDSEVPTKENYIGQIDTMSQRSCYDVGKLAVETLSYIYNKYHGVNVKLVRLFNCIGYINQDDGRVLPNFISNILQGKKIQVYGDGKQTRTFCWFTDTLTGCLKVLLRGGHTPYNVGNQENEISMVDLARLVEKVSGKTNIVEMINSPKVYIKEPLRRCPDISKLKNELDYNPKVDMETGIRKFYEWAKINYKY